MPSTHSLLSSLEVDFSNIHFAPGEAFEWHPDNQSVMYDLSDPHLDSRLLHEVSHAVLEHRSYERDIDLIAMERDAWQYARMELGPRYSVAVDGDTIDEDMNTYRDWLHKRSSCPYC